MSYKWHLAGSVLLGTTAAVAAFLLLLQIQHWRQDDQLLHALVGIVNLNVQTGRLTVPEPAASVAPKPETPPPAK